MFSVEPNREGHYFFKLHSGFLHLLPSYLFTAHPAVSSGNTGEEA